jgi:hypothetical protein
MAMQTRLLTFFLFLLFTTSSVLAARPSINELNTRLNQQQVEIDDLQRRLTETESLLIEHLVHFNQTLQATCEHMIAQGIPPLDICPINSLPSKTIFIGGGFSAGDLGGLEGADALCNELSDETLLISGTYKAWLSSNTVDARDRLTHNPGPYKLPNGIVVAESWADLVDGTLHHAINVNQHGGSTVWGNTVWTATSSSGQLTSAAGTCSDWTDNAGPGGANMGLFYFSDSNWTQASGAICSAVKPIYCIQQ